MTYRPTRRAVAVVMGALLLFGVGTNVQAGWVLAVAALLLGILLTGILLPLWNINGISVERIVPRVAVAGDPVPVTIGVTNGSRQIRALLRITDDFLGRASAVVELIGPGATQTFVGERTDARRGVHTTGGFELETGAPFGLVRIRRTDRMESPIVVHPRTYDASGWKSRGPAGWPAPASLGDVSSVRDYRPGDPLRHIHWRSVARRGQLVVREFDREDAATTAVFADVPGSHEVADAIASVACSIAKAALTDGDVKIDGTPTRSLEAVLDWGARLEPRLNMHAPDERADSIVYVGTAELAPVDALVRAASAIPVTAVLVADGSPTGHIVVRLRGAGAAVASIAPEEVEAWFRNGCSVT